MPWQQHYLTLCGQKDTIDNDLTDAELFGKETDGAQSDTSSDKDALNERPKDEDERAFREALKEGLVCEEPEPTIKKLPKIGRLSKKDIQVLLWSQNVFNDFADNEEAKRQAKAIRRVNPSPYMIERHTAQAYIVRALYKSDAPLHRDQLLVEMERLGWRSRASLFNKTKYIERLCSKNDYMLRRVRPAVWALRQGFLGHPLTRPIPQANAVLQPTSEGSRPKDRAPDTGEQTCQAVP
jgi:hypothetical protein